jgi:GTP cyclohydrolase I
MIHRFAGAVESVSFDIGGGFRETINRSTHQTARYNKPHELNHHRAAHHSRVPPLDDKKLHTSRVAKKDQSLADGTAEVDYERIERAVRDILLAVGEDPDREGLKETPGRVARMYAEMFSGLRRDPRELLRKTFTQKYDEMVLVKDIDFQSMCEHHLLPFRGKAHIAYLPNGKIVGLSKLARAVEAVSRRPQVQERMTEELADIVLEVLDAKGVGVILEASHSCMTIRGVRKSSSICTTSAMRGAFQANSSTRSELMALVYGSRV